MRSHQEEKLDALQNEVVNSEIMSLDENKKLSFIRLIDEITPLHIKVLEFLSDPMRYKNKLEERKNRGNSMMRSSTFYHHASQVWDLVYPDLKSSDSFLKQCTKDLYNRGLIFKEDMHGEQDYE